MIFAIRWSCAPTRRSACRDCSRAIRKGNVAVANALGSGVLESAAWLGFLPADRSSSSSASSSILPSVASWWCGEPPAFESVIAQPPAVW